MVYRSKCTAPNLLLRGAVAGLPAPSSTELTEFANELNSTNWANEKTTLTVRKKSPHVPRCPQPNHQPPPITGSGKPNTKQSLYYSEFSLAGPRPGNNHPRVRGAPGNIQARQATELHGRPDPDQDRGISRIRPQVVRRQARSQRDSHQNNGRTDPVRSRDSCDRGSKKPRLVTTGAQHNSN